LGAWQKTLVDKLKRCGQKARLDGRRPLGNHFLRSDRAALHGVRPGSRVEQQVIAPVGLSSRRRLYFGASYPGMEDQQQAKESVAKLSVASNSALVAGKLAVGLAVGSVSILSEAIHSGMDLLAAGIALCSVRHAAKPADGDHAYGHGKIESISGLAEALLIFAAAVWIIYEAAHKLIQPEPLERVWLGVVVMGVSSLVNVVVSQRLFRVARETESIALEADAWHLRTDVYTSASVMAGLGVLWLAGVLAPGWDLSWLDPVVAIAVALLILRAAYDVTAKSGRDLLDSRLPHEEEAWFAQCIMRHAPQVLGYHRLRTRRAGAARFVDVHVEVPGSMSVEESHSVADSIEAQMRERFPRTSITVHIEPRSDRGSLPDRDG
jgi:cation diffusion facilitator family transporter